MGTIVVSKSARVWVVACAASLGGCAAEWVPARYGLVEARTAEKACGEEWRGRLTYKVQADFTALPSGFAPVYNFGASAERARLARAHLDACMATKGFFRKQ